MSAEIAFMVATVFERERRRGGGIVRDVGIGFEVKES